MVSVRKLSIDTHVSHMVELSRTGGWGRTVPKDTLGIRASELRQLYRDHGRGIGCDKGH